MYKHPRILPSVSKQDSSSDGKCEEHWDYFATTDRCYLARGSFKSWEDAKNECEKYSASLVTIESIEENDYLKEMILTEGRLRAWIGMKAAFNWYDNSKVDFQNWDPEEPVTDLDLCVIMYGDEDPHQGRWYVDKCELADAYPTICKMLPKM